MIKFIANDMYTIVCWFVWSRIVNLEGRLSVSSNFNPEYKYILKYMTFYLLSSLNWEIMWMLSILISLILDIKDTTDIPSSASYFDLYLKYDIHERLHWSFRTNVTTSIFLWTNLCFIYLFVSQLVCYMRAPLHNKAISLKIKYWRRDIAKSLFLSIPLKRFMCVITISLLGMRIIYP